MKGNGLSSWQTAITVLGSSISFLLTWLLNSKKQKDDKTAQLFEDIRKERDSERDRNNDLQEDNDKLRAKLSKLIIDFEKLRIANINITSELEALKSKVNQNSENIKKENGNE